MANKEAKVNSLGSSSRKSRRYKNYYDQQEQQQLNSLARSTNAGRVTRFNIYETIDTPVKRNVLNRLSSSSTSKLNDLEESKRLIVDHAGQSSENQLNKLSQNRHDYDHENQSSMNCDQLFRRRYLNDNNKFANNNNNQKSSNLRSATANQSISTNPYSEILTPTTPVPSSSSGVVEGGVSISNYTPDGLSHYQVPPTNTNTTYAAVIHHHHHHHASPTGAPSVNDEVGQIIETRRKRTLLLLKSKEAPKASFEITSPIEETGFLPPPSPPPLALQPPQQLSSSTTLLTETAPFEQRPISPTVLSDYENVNTNLNLDDNNDVELLRHRSLDKLDQDISQDIDQTAKDCEEEQSVVSPSESQNFNTLSIVSDILGDLSQEDHSIVNQLSQG